ncbi:hypothetical protein KDJ21_007350 [Metabacillus litoralis]|uniref:hypothetical protein n=1 Tax=Metabacillus TaxID=2675233 RepID=UPI001B92ECC5|nr:hypothetical protein [Metabacillus litoralis]UHA61465.1 hypothetical protein KDJ21_007350 [Metabacillus litoralis]
MKMKLVLGSLFIAGALAGCSQNEEAAKTEEEIREEVKAELEQEMKDDLKETLKEEIKAELTETEIASTTQSTTEKQASSSNFDLSNLEPYTTTHLTFSNYSMTKQSDGYLLVMDVENTNKEFDVAFGWGTAGTATLITTEGKYTENFPHMEKLQAGTTKSYTFKFTEASGEPQELIVSNVLVVDQQGGMLPKPGSNEEFTISLK